MKKASISINTIIALVLILVIILLIGWKLLSSFSGVNQLRTCEQQGGKCIEKSCDGTIASFDCPEKKICCMEIG